MIDSQLHKLLGRDEIEWDLEEIAAYLKDHRPETTVREAEVDSPPREESRRPRPGGDRKGRRQGSRRRR